MLVSFHLWKIILGLIVSAVLIVFTVTYLGEYTKQQDDLLRARIINNFEIGALDVYTSGNLLEFNDFSKIPFDFLFSMSGTPGYTQKDLPKKSFKIPVFMSYGNDMVVWRGENDLGWWKFRYIIAMEQTEIVISMEQNTQETWDVLRDLVNSLPDTTGFENKVTYALCDGKNIKKAFCDRNGKSPCDGKLFLEEIDSGKAPVGFSKCTAEIKEGQRLVTIANDCSNIRGGICVEPGSGTGKMYIAGTDNVLIYTDPLDIAVAVVGYTREDPYGVWGENFYKYKNLEMMRELKLASEIISRRSLILSNEIERIANSDEMDQDAEEVECIELFRNLGGIAEAMMMYIEDENNQRVTELIAESGAIKQEIIEKGCDYA